MNILGEILQESLGGNVTLYRAVPRSGTRYPGQFWTEIESLANAYSRKTKGPSPREVVGKTLFIPSNRVFNESNLSGSEKSYWGDKLEKWFEKNFPDEDIDDSYGPYLYDVLFRNETDFAYPSKYCFDDRFLIENGFDAVYFDKEGGDVVKSWYFPDPTHSYPSCMRPRKY